MNLVGGGIRSQDTFEKEEKEDDLIKIEVQVPNTTTHKGSLNAICEPSIDEEDESQESSDVVYEGKIDFNVKSKEAHELSCEDMNVKDLSRQAKEERQNTQPADQKDKSYQIIEQNGEGDQNIRVIDMRNSQNLKKGISEYAKQSFVNNHQDKTADVSSCNIPLQTGIVSMLLENS